MIAIECVPAEKWGVWTVVLNGSPYREIHQAIFGKTPAFSAPCSSVAEFSVLFRETEVSRAKQFALRKLTAVNLCSYELRASLIKYLVSADAAEEVIEECLRLGYINDDEWLTGFVRRLAAKKKSRMEIRMKLQGKGIPEEVFAPYLDALCGAEEILLSIQGLLATRYRNRDLSDFKERQKVIAALARKGFSYDQIAQCLASHMDDSAEF